MVMSAWKHVVACVVGSLGIHIVVVLAVLLLASYQDQPEIAGYTRGNQRHVYRTHNTFGATLVTTYQWIEGIEPSSDQVVLSREAAQGTIDWSQIRKATSPAGEVVEEGIGWPWRWLVSRYEINNKNNGSWSSSIVLKQGDRQLENGWTISGVGAMTVPVGIWWPGLVGNLVTTSCVIWLSCFLFVNVRSAIRRQHGRCVICNYDLTRCVGAICPECGRASRLESICRERNC